MSEPTQRTPYSPPSSMLSEPPLDPAESGASRLQRFGNLAIDQLALGVLGAALAIARGTDVPEPAILESLLATVVYYAAFEATSGRTLGKLVTGTRVVAEDGAPARFGQILGRTLARFIPFEPFSVLFGGTPPRGWHDSLSGTRVVRAR